MFVLQQMGKQYLKFALTVTSQWHWQVSLPSKLAQLTVTWSTGRPAEGNSWSSRPNSFLKSIQDSINPAWYESPGSHASRFQSYQRKTTNGFSFNDLDGPQPPLSIFRYCPTLSSDCHPCVVVVDGALYLVGLCDCAYGIQLCSSMCGYLCINNAA